MRPPTEAGVDAGAGTGADAGIDAGAGLPTTAADRAAPASASPTANSASARRRNAVVAGVVPARLWRERGAEETRDRPRPAPWRA
ncbi:hypothetical protein ACFT9I_29505 [Streptomyces sp. NPDC057137]|uniref:hypothetical protein n=1 Tax=Streptomyces sp. NPDC057137 TaxID=3346030 RepID=UPI0036449C9E